MLTPINSNVAPNDGFKWTDDLGFRVRGFNLPVVLEQIKARLISRGMFVGEGWQDEVIDQICRQSKVECRDRAIPERPVSWRDFENFGTAFRAYVESGGETVNQEEAERRASICVKCKFNAPLSGICYSCAGLLSWAIRLGGNLKTSHDENLHQCAQCGCQLRLAIHLPLSVDVVERAELSDFPVYCWKKPN